MEIYKYQGKGVLRQLGAPMSCGEQAGLVGRMRARRTLQGGFLSRQWPERDCENRDAKGSSSQ